MFSCCTFSRFCFCQFINLWCKLNKTCAPFVRSIKTGICCDLRKWKSRLVEPSVYGQRKLENARNHFQFFIRNVPNCKSLVQRQKVINLCPRLINLPENKFEKRLRRLLRIIYEVGILLQHFFATVFPCSPESSTARFNVMRSKLNDVVFVHMFRKWAMSKVYRTKIHFFRAKRDIDHRECLWQTNDLSSWLRENSSFNYHICLIGFTSLRHPLRTFLELRPPIRHHLRLMSSLRSLHLCSSRKKRFEHICKLP